MQRNLYQNFSQVLKGMVERRSHAIDAHELTFRAPMLSHAFVCHQFSALIPMLVRLQIQKKNETNQD
jgi:hypothetical protein